MKLLLLGGPRFLGRAIADAALEHGHGLTFFNRGTTNPELYPEVERIVGDRAGDLSALDGREWDAVVDTSGYLPRDASASAEALASAEIYCFVSSVSVYADFSQPNDEASPVAQLGDVPDDVVTEESYGPLKALCEGAVHDVFAERALIVRPGLIVGPHDPTGRFTYWPHRVARGGEVLAPAPPDEPTQIIDVRDLGEWIISLCERRVSGVFNATHPGVSWESSSRSACPSQARTRRSRGWAETSSSSRRSASGWSSRSGSRIPRSRTSIAWTSVERSRPDSRSDRSRRAFEERSSSRSRPMPPA